MTVVNQGSIFSSLVPNVYVSRITLESGGSVPYVDNPHIDERATDKILDFIAKDDLDKYYETVGMVNQTPQENSLKVNIKMMVNEKVNGNLVGTWFSQEDYIEYVNISILQLTTEDQIEKSKDLVWIRDAILTGEMSKKTLSLAKDLMNKKITPTKDENDNVVYQGVMEAEFSLPTSKPDTLAYLAISHLNINKISNDFEINPYFLKVTDIMGKPALDLVIQNQQLVQQSAVYFTLQDEIWAGEIEQIAPGEFTSKDSNPANVVPLIQKKIPNTKIQDFRSFRELEKVKLDLHFQGNAVYPAVSNPYSPRDDLDISRKANEYLYFTEITRDRYNRAKFAFFLDYKRIIEENTPYGKLLRTSDPEFLNKILSQAKIKQIKVVRRRMNPGRSYNKLGNPIESKSTFKDRYGKEEIVETLVTASDTTGLIKAYTDKGSIKELTRLQLTRRFTFSDYSMSYLTDGDYQYGVELNIEVILSKFLKDLLRSAEKAQKDVEEYEMAFSHLTFTNPKVSEEIDNKRIDAISKYISVVQFLNTTIGDKKTDGDFDYLARRFYFLMNFQKGIDVFLKSNGSLIKTLKRMIDVEKSSVNEYEGGKYQSPTGTSRSTRKASFVLTQYNQEIFDADYPRDSGYEYFEEDFARPPSSPLTPGEETNSFSLREMSPGQSRLRFKQETRKYFNSDNPSIEMKGYTPNDTIENSEYSFITPFRATVAPGDFMRLAIPGGDGSIQINIQHETATILLDKIRAMNASQTGQPLLLKEVGDNYLSSNQMNESDLLFDQLDKYGISMTSGFNPSSWTPENSAVLLESGDPFIVDAIATIDKSDPVDSYNKVNPISYLKDVLATFSNVEVNNNFYQTNTIEMFRLPAEGKSPSDNIFSWVDIKDVREDPIFSLGRSDFTGLTGRDKQTALKALPNQIKSVMLSSRDSTQTNINAFEPADYVRDIEKSSTFLLNYNLIATIEFMSGYEATEEGTLVNKPQWRVLKRTDFENLRRANQDILCRLKPYRNKYLGIGMPEDVEMSIFDQYFIIRAAPETAGQTAAEFFESRIQSSARETAESSNVEEKQKFLEEEKLKERLKKIREKTEGIPPEYSSPLTLPPKGEKAVIKTDLTEI
tara:strand:+ start:3240 stop:6572 length:3333 start_codon:yes stop_codon:yes gene_type:complete